MVPMLVCAGFFQSKVMCIFLSGIREYDRINTLFQGKWDYDIKIFWKWKLFCFFLFNNLALDAYMHTDWYKQKIVSFYRKYLFLQIQQ